MKRHQVIKHILTLDPVKDHLEIVRLTTLYEFPLQTERALEFALFRTFAVPSIGILLDKTKEFGNRPQKRYDDTDLILSEVLEHGYDSPRGMEAINRLNAIHSRFRISNEDHIYVLSTFVLEPARWLDRYGYRKTSHHEKIAAHTYWKEVGKRMGIQNIPKTYEELETYNIQYEHTNFKFNAGSRRVADATVSLFLGWFLPKWLHFMGRPLVVSVMDEPLRRAFGYSKPFFLTRWATFLALKSDGWLHGWHSLPKDPYLRTRLKRKTYPKGYTIPELGPK